MIGLPKSTEFNRRIPKQKFYENLSISPTLKRIFVEQIKVIWWRDKIATTTINLAAGETVTEIEIFEICLSAPQLNEAVLRQIDKKIPYHILFLLEYEGLYQVWIAYKETITSSTNAFRVDKYYHTDWLKETDLPLKLEGLNIDQVYENFVRQIAGESFSDKSETLKESIARDSRKRELQKQIAILQAKVYKEKQLNKQVELNAELKRMKKEWEELL